MRKVFVWLLVCILTVGCLSACGAQQAADSGQLRVVTTIFPVYDWMRNILGEQAEDADGHRPDPVRTYLSGDESKTGIYRWECALSGDTQEAAKSDLQKQKWVKSVTAKLRGVHFGTDYSLGDSLQFKMQAGGYFWKS